MPDRGVPGNDMKVLTQQCHLPFLAATCVQTNAHIYLLLKMCSVTGYRRSESSAMLRQLFGRTNSILNYNIGDYLRL